MPTTALFNESDLEDWLDVPVTASRATVVERVVWGWLLPVLQVTERPEQVSDQLFGWAVELGGIAHENPSGLASYQLGSERSQYSLERRRQILAEVATGGVVTSEPTGGVASPVGSFPPAQAWPDPIYPGPAARWYDL